MPNAAAEGSACRPDSVTDRVLTCGYSQARPTAVVTQIERRRRRSCRGRTARRRSRAVTRGETSTDGIGPLGLSAPRPEIVVAPRTDPLPSVHRTDRRGRWHARRTPAARQAPGLGAGPIEGMSGLVTVGLLLRATIQIPGRGASGSASDPQPVRDRPMGGRTYAPNAGTAWRVATKAVTVVGGCPRRPRVP